MLESFRYKVHCCLGIAGGKSTENPLKLITIYTYDRISSCVKFRSRQAHAALIIVKRDIYKHAHTKTGLSEASRNPLINIPQRKFPLLLSPPFPRASPVPSMCGFFEPLTDRPTLSEIERKKNEWRG